MFDKPTVLQKPSKNILLTAKQSPVIGKMEVTVRE